MEHNFERLKAHILPLSRAKVFDVARTEWRLVAVEISEEFDNCPCGQEIKEHCYIKNSVTEHETYVGNVCINRFIGIDTGNLFGGLRRIAENDTTNANADVIEYANERGFLYDKEYEFLMSTRLKRTLSDKQKAWKRKINRRILNKIVVQRRTSR
ncbi:MAG: hypothetical protein JSR20_10430 [Nitrospira sp.]|nr:hypothetical protein [Nitrospira sp.]